PNLRQRPADVVVPIFALTGRGVMMSVSGLHSPDQTQNKSHTDLHAVGNIGYLEFYSQLDGEKVQTALIYFRSDSAFIPLKSTNDFSARLEWERKKFASLREWFDRHLGPADEDKKLFPNGGQSTK